MKLIIGLSLLFYTFTISQGEETVEDYLSEIGELESSGASSGDDASDSDEVIEGPYKMGQLITCLEQNDEDPFGFKEKDTFGNLDSQTCQEQPGLCARYQDCVLDPEYCGTGDVCDHDDPIVYDDQNNRLIRDSCKFSVMFLAAIDEEKSWAWKCARHEVCGIKNFDQWYYDSEGERVYGVGQMGCLVNRKRIQCCCQYDYCQKEDIYLRYAAFGRPDHFPIDFQALVNIDPGDVTVVYHDLGDDIVIPDWPCVHSGECPYPDGGTGTSTDSSASSESSASASASSGGYSYESEASPEAETETETETENVTPPDYPYLYAKNEHMNELHDTQNGLEAGINMVNLLVIFTFFVIGTLCLGVGVYIGTKLNNNPNVAEIKMNQFADDL